MVMRMATNIVWPKIDGGHVAQSLQDVIEQLDRAESEVVLDWSCVKRLDPDALRALAQLAGRADDKSVKIALRGVSVDVYKVLKLMKLTARFSVVTA
jgi:anti-anti-sigma regulatory factor